MSDKFIINGVDIFKELEKKYKLLKLYKELTTVKEDMLSCCEVVDDEYYDLLKEETYLENEIKELEEWQLDHMKPIAKT